MTKGKVSLLYLVCDCKVSYCRKKIYLLKALVCQLEELVWSVPLALPKDMTSYTIFCWFIYQQQSAVCPYKRTSCSVIQSFMFIRERSRTASNLSFNFTLLIHYRLTSPSCVVSCFVQTVIPYTRDLLKFVVRLCQYSVLSSTGDNLMLFCGLSLTKEHILLVYNKEDLKVR